MTVTTNHTAARSATRTHSTTSARSEPGIRLQITLEVLIYAGLALLALALRVADLDRAPLTDSEARQALAALRVVNEKTPGDPLVADSPIMFILNAITFGFVPDGSEVAARLPVALAGVLLVLAPVLWRRYLNPLPPLIMSLLLAISPVALMASRTSSPVIWTMLLAMVAPWLALRFVETRREAWAVAATAVFGAMIFLTEPAGFLAVLALGFAVLFAWLTDPESENETWNSLRDLARRWPWTNGGVVAGVIVIAVGTAMFWVPAGLTVIGTVLATGLEGFITRTENAPFIFPFWISLRYETGLLLFGVLAAYRAVTLGGFFERALVGWLLAGLFWSLAYAGAGAAHALWLTLPLCVLASLMITNWLVERAQAIWQVPSWAISAHALITLSLWLAVGVSAILLGKWLLVDLPDGVTKLRALVRAIGSGAYLNMTVYDPQSGVVDVQGVQVFPHVLGNIQMRFMIILLVSVLNGVLFFLIGSIWGSRVAWRGFALGTLAFLLFVSFGLGGQVAFNSPGDPREFWYTDAVTSDAYELRATLREMSLRDTGEPHLMVITAQLPDDGALAWVLRDFPNAVFVDGIGPEVNSAAVLVPAPDAQTVMGADYIGKDLITRQTWDRDTLSWKDALMWFYRSDSQWKPVPSEQLILWIRNDVYGVDQVLAE